VVAFGLDSFVGTAFAAAAPPNDLIGGATVVSALPFSATLDTTGATTDANDVQVNETCGAPVTNNSVWYTFTAGSSDTLLAVDTTGSTFSSGVIIATGTPGALTAEACGPVTAKVAVASGTTYHILAFDDTGSGGTLHISIHGPGPVPANDTIGRAATVSRLPFRARRDTTGATTDTVDTQANASCGAPETGNSVWYKFKVARSHLLVVDATRSDYNVGILIATGKPDALTTVKCAPFFLKATAKPNTTYYVMIFDAFGTGGGTLRLNIDHAPRMRMNLYKKARIDTHGAVHLTGTYSCTRATRVEIAGTLVEIAGDKVPTGGFALSVPAPNCNGNPHSWEGLVPPPRKGSFVPGKAAVFTHASACGAIACASVSKKSVVKLAHSASTSGTAPDSRVHTRTVRRSSGRTWGNAVHDTSATWSHSP
jgi:hypothetical protein